MRRLHLLFAGLLALWAAPASVALAWAAPAAPGGAQHGDAQHGGTRTPVAAAPAAGALVVPAGTVRTGDVIVVSGDVDVRGAVRGDVVALFGDVTVRPGAHVTGSVRSVFGTTRAQGARVDGGVRANWRAQATAAPRPRTPWEAATVTLAWFGVLLVLGLGLLAGASTQLDAVAGALETSPGRAVATGVAGQLALAPGLVILVAALAVTIVGVLAVPLAVVAFVLAAAGLLTLGFLAAAFVLGRWATGGRTAAGRPRAAAARGASLRALAVGIALFFAVWMAAALLGSIPAAGLLVRTAALAVTWLAVTAGFGAALLSRGGTRAGHRALAPPAAGDDARSGVPVWQTPTPISGVVAARRPVMTRPAAATPTAGAGVGDP